MHMNSVHPRRVRQSTMRIIALGMLLAGVLLSASCGCTAGIFVPSFCDPPRRTITRPPWNPGPSPVHELHHEYVDAELHHETAVPRGASSLFNFPAIRATGMLPRLPKYVGAARTAAEVVEYERLGSDTYARGGSAKDYFNSLELSAPGNGVAWAVYKIGVFDAEGVQTTIHVETAAGYFPSGPHPGYWVGLANYSRLAWETKALTTDADYSRAFPVASTYLNGGNLYVFVLIADGQSMLVDRVRVEMKYSDWDEVAIDTSGNVGWTPAIDFTITDNPLVVYSDYDTGRPQWAVGDRSKPNGILDPGSWIISDIDSQPEGIGTWLDVVVDPATGMPRVSMCYTGINSGVEDNSLVGMSVLFQAGESLSWLNYTLGGSVDGAVSTSIDVHPDTGAYGIANSAANTYNGEPAYDMQYRVFQINDPANYEDDEEVSLTRNFGKYFFGKYFLFPHLRYRPTGGNATACVNGGYMIYEESLGSWIALYDVSNTSSQGSIAYNPVTSTLGQSYATVDEGQEYEDLTYVEYNADFLAFSETVYHLPTPLDGTHIGRSSQVEFMPDGTPGIAYTEQDNGEVYIRYAYMVGEAWAIETVSNDPSTPSATNPLLLVDLAYDSAGMAAICYNHIVGTTSTMRVAFRGL